MAGSSGLYSIGWRESGMVTFPTGRITKHRQHHHHSYWTHLSIFWLLLAVLLVVDWVYLLYHHLAGNQTYREANFLASLPLYFLAGTLWLYRGSLKDAWANVRHLWDGAK